MAETLDEPLPRLWSEPWAAQAAVQAEAVRTQMQVALAAEPPDPRRQAAADAVEKLLAAVDTATQAQGRRRRRSLADRWRGGAVEHAYQSLHAAKIALVDLLAPEDLDALTPGVLAKLETCLPPEDVRRLKFEALIRPNPRVDQRVDRAQGRVRADVARHIEARKRAQLKQAMEIAYDAADQLHARVRGFRNVLLAAAVFMALFMTALVVVVARYPDAMPLCFTPSITAPQATPNGPATRTVCPSGEDPPLAVPDADQPQHPEPGDVIIVAGLGLLGGALAAAFAIRKLRGSSTPYGVPLALTWLKVPTGSLTAVAGILLLGGNFVPGLSELDSQRQILAYALVFGYAQQLATRFIDDRAQSLLNSVPSTDPEAKQPTPPTRGELPATDVPPATDGGAQELPEAVPAMVEPLGPAGPAGRVGPVDPAEPVPEEPQQTAVTEEAEQDSPDQVEVTEDRSEDGVVDDEDVTHQDEDEDAEELAGEAVEYDLGDEKRGGA
ncbi:hypothetical protein Q2K19_30865 [Micromonospora soli]|uniref:hypothetical protein n=1 Tax=Micromonospora sp. NBRC 110009 TaxID=3061627 RepID=UPI002670D600|nr:hypothetical protein [Micromonospora sp. NBRC 110009]WKT98503.1 hypothetical protein Q2K19_30865 [Micromonospora sp. NBRC 110009]